MEGLRAAVVGTGFIGRVHARSARLAGARLVGVAGSSPDSGRRAAAELHAERAFASGDEAVEADDVDVVHVCTPNHLHEPLALKALAAGKHVVCEKPVALDAAGAQRLADAAESAGRVVAVPFVYRFHPTVREARARVAAGELGRLRLLHGSYQQDWLLRPDDVNWRVDAALGGPSRAFADIGSHWCDLVEFVSGTRVARLIAHTAVAVPERAAVAAPGSGAVTFGAPSASDPAARRPVDTEDVAIVMFETAGGALGSMFVSQISAGRKNRLWFELDGAEASVAFDEEQPERLWIGGRERSLIVDRDAAHNAPGAARLSLLPPGHAQGYNDCFDLFVADVYAAITAGAAAGTAVGSSEGVPDGLPLIADGLRAARITDAVLASARTRTWIEVPT